MRLTFLDPLGSDRWWDGRWSLARGTQECVAGHDQPARHHKLPPPAVRSIGPATAAAARLRLRRPRAARRGRPCVVACQHAATHMPERRGAGLVGRGGGTCGPIAAGALPRGRARGARAACGPNPLGCAARDLSAERGGAQRRCACARYDDDDDDEDE
eukprot:scaffold5217_cov632-Prasinococcus_capsulatus_cf.AAC.1